MHAFDLERLARTARSSSGGRSGRERCGRSTASSATLDADMLVIADAERAVGDRRRDGRRELGDRPGDDAHDRARERVFPAGVGAPHEQAAGPEDRGVDPVRARRRRRSAARRHRPRGGAVRSRSAPARRSARSIDRYPAPAAGRAVHAARRADRARARPCDVPADDVPRYPRAARVRGCDAADGAEPGWTVTVPTLPRRRDARSGSHRGSRPALRLRPPAVRPSRARGAAAAARSRAIAARPRGPRRCSPRRILRSR